MQADTKRSTHPIQVDVRHTEDAANVFDMICYRKGASFIKQMAVYVGDELLQSGIKYYFDKFAMGNAGMADFMDCLDVEAKRLGKEDLQIKKWAEHWVTTAGINDVTVKMQDGKIAVE